MLMGVSHFQELLYDLIFRPEFFFLYLFLVARSLGIFSFLLYGFKKLGHFLAPVQFCTINV